MELGLGARVSGRVWGLGCGVHEQGVRSEGVGRRVQDTRRRGRERGRGGARLDARGAVAQREPHLPLQTPHLRPAPPSQHPRSHREKVLR
eukprot:3125184-Rhodomonas_salina.1